MILVLVFQENVNNSKNKTQLMVIKINLAAQIQQQIQAQSKQINNNKINSSIKNITMEDFLKVKN